MLRPHVLTLRAAPAPHRAGDFGSKYAYLEESVTCAGLQPIGTGPFKLAKKETNADGIDEAVFARHGDYWGGVPDIEFLHLKYYETTDDVEAALLSGDLDMALGIGPLTPKQVQDLKFYNSNVVDVRHSDVMQHALMVFNTNATNTNDITTRRAIIHAVDKARFIKEEFAGLEQPVTQLLPFNAPYCNVDLSPKFAFDFEKAELLNCPVVQSPMPPPSPSLPPYTVGLKSESDDVPPWVVIVIVIVSLLFVAVCIFASLMYFREKQGKPIFKNLEGASAGPAVEMNRA